jgi:general secretion pathway protein F
MPVYDYRALNSKGRSISGIIDASGAESARLKLKGRGLYVQTIAEAKRRTGKKSFSLGSKKNFTAHLTRQMGFLLGAGMPVVAALDTVIEQTEDSTQKRMIADIRERIREGLAVSQAFAAYPDYFSKMYVNTVHAGEVSGNLEAAFRRLADIFDKNRALTAKLRSSLAYPVVLLLFSFLIIIFLVSFIVPTFAGLFEDFGRVLPLPTRMIIGFSDMVTSFWWVFFVVAALGYVAVRRAYRTPGGKQSLDRFVLKVPLVRELLLDSFRIRFSHTMSLLLGSGIGIIEALENTAGVFRNGVFSQHLHATAERVRKGTGLSAALSMGDPGQRLITPTMLGMIRAGEAGDTVPGVLDHIGRNLEVELSERVGVLTSLIEPLLILVIGGIVAFVVLSIVLPIFQFNQMIG